MAQIIKHRRGTLAELNGITLNNGELGIVTGSVTIGDAPIKTAIVVGNTDGTNRLSIGRLVQGSGSATLVGKTGGANWNDMIYYDTNDYKLQTLHTTNGVTTLDLTGNIAGGEVGGTLDVTGRVDAQAGLDVTGSLNIGGNTVLGDASGDSLTINAATINTANIAAGTDNTVVVYNGSTLVTDEIDSKVWDGNLVDTDGSGANNELVTWSDSDSIIGEGNLTFDGSTLTVTGNAVVTSHISSSANITGSVIYASSGFYGDGSNLTGVAQDIDSLDSYGAATIHQTQDEFLISDNGTEKRITFSNLQDSIFADITGDVAIAGGGVATIQATSVEGSMLNTNVISGQTEMTGDVADTDELMVSDAGTVKRADFSVVRDAVFGDVSGDILIADGGGATIQANSVALGTDTTNTYISTITPSSGILLDGGSSATSTETATPTLSVDSGSMAAYFSSSAFSKVSGDATVAAGGALTIAATSVENSMLADDAVDSDELASGAVDDDHLSDGVATGLAGAGMTATSGVLNVIGGTGITANANEITTTDGDIVHDNLSGFVANEHIDHSGVTLTAGAGLSGGGTIAASRTFKVDSGSMAAFYSSSAFSVISGDVAITAGGVATVTGATTNAALTAGVGLSTTSGTFNGGSAVTFALDLSELSDVVIATGDKLAVLDSDGANEQLESVDDLFKIGPALVTEAAIANGDYITFLDGGSTGEAKKEALADLTTLFAGDGLQAASSVMAVDVSDFAGTGLEDDSSENLRLATQGTGISGGNGSTLSITPGQTAITSVYNTALILGSAASQEYVTFGTSNEVNTFVNNTERLSATNTGVDVTGVLTVSSNATIEGNLIVNGLTTFISSSTLDIGDNIIVLNSVSGSTNAGIQVIDRVGTAHTGSFLWNAANDYWFAGISGSTHYRVPVQAAAGDLTENKPVIVDGSGRIESSANITDDGSTVDFNDVDLTSLDKLEGVDANTYVDIGGSGLIVTKGTIQPATNGGNDLGATGTRYANLWLSANADLEGDIDVNGTANLDNTDIDGTLDVQGVADFQARVDAQASLAVTGSVYVSAGASVTAASASLVSFRNANTQLGYLASADTQAVTTGLVGYNTSTGNLTISSVIDGGSF